MNTYVRLVKLVDDCNDCDNEERELWMRDLENCCALDGYTYALDERYNLVVELFDSNELTAVNDVYVYDIMGSENGTNTFYMRDCVVYKHNVTGCYYVDDDEELGVF